MKVQALGKFATAIRPYINTEEAVLVTTTEPTALDESRFKPRITKNIESYLQMNNLVVVETKAAEKDSVDEAEKAAEKDSVISDLRLELGEKKEELATLVKKIESRGDKGPARSQITKQKELIESIEEMEATIVELKGA